MILISTYDMVDENKAASTLIHEDTHIGQGLLTYLNALEAQALYAYNLALGVEPKNFSSLTKMSVALWCDAEIEAHEAERTNFGHTQLDLAGRAFVIDEIARYQAIKDSLELE